MLLCEINESRATQTFHDYVSSNRNDSVNETPLFIH